METASVEAVDPAVVKGVSRRGLGDALGTEAVAVNYYTVPPGGRLAGLHAHADQAETFVVLSEAVGFEMLDGRIRVGEGEAVRFPPGEF